MKSTDLHLLAKKLAYDSHFDQVIFTGYRERFKGKIRIQAPPPVVLNTIRSSAS